MKNNAKAVLGVSEASLLGEESMHLKSYDVIGDIHGHADTLRALLAKLDYTERGGAYRHAERQAVFVGDFIDRGPKIRETLQIVRAMVDAGSARAVLGNHEWNAVRYHTLDERGRALRPQSAKHTDQHQATLDQVAEPFSGEWKEWLAWFKTLPFFLDLGGLRVAHASWHPESIAFIGDRLLTDEAFLHGSAKPHQKAYRDVRNVLCGPELDLPANAIYRDKNGHAHDDIRVRWFGDRSGGEAVTYRSLVIPASDTVPDLPVPPEVLAAVPHYPETEPPVIFGHYWIPPAAPSPLARNAACVDYSVALAKGGGLLAAYRWSGEAELAEANFVTVPRV